MSTNPYQSPGAASGYSHSKPTIKDILFSFKGRIPRRTYWLWGIVSGLVIGLIVGLCTPLLITMPPPPVDPNAIPAQPEIKPIGFLIFALAYIPMIWIGLALGVKRWHDRAKSGWWILIGLIPIVGGIWMFVECGCLRGTVGPNQYGEDPT